MDDALIEWQIEDGNMISYWGLDNIWCIGLIRMSLIFLTVTHTVGCVKLPKSSENVSNVNGSESSGNILRLKQAGRKVAVEEVEKAMAGKEFECPISLQPIDPDKHSLIWLPLKVASSGKGVIQIGDTFYVPVTRIELLKSWVLQSNRQASADGSRPIATHLLTREPLKADTSILISSNKHHVLQTTVGALWSDVQRSIYFKYLNEKPVRVEALNQDARGFDFRMLQQREHPVDFRAASFKNSNLNGAILSDIDLTRATFEGGSYKGTVFTGAKMGEVYIFNADLSEAIISTEDLKDAWIDLQTKLPPGVRANRFCRN